MDFMESSFTQKLPLNGLLNCFIIFNLDGELLFHLELPNYCIRITFVVWDLLFRRFKILLALSTHVWTYLFQDGSDGLWVLKNLVRFSGLPWNVTNLLDSLSSSVARETTPDETLGPPLYAIILLGESPRWTLPVKIRVLRSLTSRMCRYYTQSQLQTIITTLLSLVKIAIIFPICGVSIDTPRVEYLWCKGCRDCSLW